MARSMPDPRLDELVTRLERAATELRGGELPPERAAALVDECARLASEASAELDRRVRAGESGVGATAPGQLALGS
jgi:hypothetical protein